MWVPSKNQIFCVRQIMEETIEFIFPPRISILGSISFRFVDLFLFLTYEKIHKNRFFNSMTQNLLLWVNLSFAHPRTAYYKTSIVLALIAKQDMSSNFSLSLMVKDSSFFIIPFIARFKKKILFCLNRVYTSGRNPKEYNTLILNTMFIGKHGVMKCIVLIIIEIITTFVILHNNTKINSSFLKIMQFMLYLKIASEQILQ